MRQLHRLAVSVCLVLVVVACGDDEGGGPIDAPTAIDAAATVDAPAGAPTCGTYCTTITTNCAAANLQYGAAADCTNTCTHMPVGTTADMSGNTLGCRIYHANAAGADPVTHCRHAGPGGNAACGADCLGFCTLVLGACTGNNQQYGGSLATCMSACANFATTPAYSASVTSGNSFACRLYHATAASTTPGTHCVHTAAAAVAPCGP